jgi:hypothetical protein
LRNEWAETYFQDRALLSRASSVGTGMTHGADSWIGVDMAPR